MLFLSGAINSQVLSDVRADVGFMIQPGMGNRTEPLRDRLWSGDNGRFAAPEEWSAPKWIRWMEALMPYQATCLFMVAPDVVADAEATLALSLPYLPVIRSLGFNAAYVSQDGATNALPWDDFDCLFVGGTDAWKLSEPSYALAAEAKARGKWLHMGRVNSLRRMRAAAISNFDSCDGTFLKYGPDVNWPRLCAMLNDINSGQRVLAA